MGEGDEGGGEEIVVQPEEVSSGKPMDKNQAYVKKMLDGCLKHGLTALCKEKPQEPIKWLAHWLLDNNPNQPRVHIFPHSRSRPMIVSIAPSSWVMTCVSCLRGSATGRTRTGHRPMSSA